MADAKRAKANAARWLLPPVVLQVAHYLDEADEVVAFLHAVPADARDEALDALALLLTQDEFLWPDTEVRILVQMDEATVIRALPALCKLCIDEDARVVAFCSRTPLPPTAYVQAAVDDLQDLESKFGNWVPSITRLIFKVKHTPLNRGVFEREVASCAKLQELSIVWDDAVDQAQLDDAMAAIAASCPRLANLRLFSTAVANLQCCKSLVAWLSQPTARVFKLFGIDFAPRAAKTLAHTLFSSTTLHTIKLFRASSVIDAFLNPSSPPLPNQLRNLALGFGSIPVDARTLAAKLSPMTIHSLDLRFDESHDISPIVATLPRTLRKLSLSTVTMTSFPTLPKLQKLDLWAVALTSDAVASMTAQLAASDSLVRLKLADADLPKNQLETILYALPRVLSRQKQPCYVGFPVSIATEMLVTVVLLLTRNTQHVWLDLTGDASLDLAMCQRLLAAFRATSRMKLGFCGEDAPLVFEEDVTGYAALHGIEFTSCWYTSPSRSPWLALA